MQHPRPVPVQGRRGSGAPTGSSSSLSSAGSTLPSHSSPPSSAHVNDPAFSHTPGPDGLTSQYLADGASPPLPPVDAGFPTKQAFRELCEAHARSAGGFHLVCKRDAERQMVLCCHRFKASRPPPTPSLATEAGHPHQVKLRPHAGTGCPYQCVVERIVDEDAGTVIWRVCRRMSRHNHPLDEVAKASTTTPRKSKAKKSDKPEKAKAEKVESAPAGSKKSKGSSSAKKKGGAAKGANKTETAQDTQPGPDGVAAERVPADSPATTTSSKRKRAGGGSAKKRNGPSNKQARSKARPSKSAVAHDLDDSPLTPPDPLPDSEAPATDPVGLEPDGQGDEDGEGEDDEDADAEGEEEDPDFRPELEPDAASERDGKGANGDARSKRFDQDRDVSADGHPTPDDAEPEADASSTSKGKAKSTTGFDRLAAARIAKAKILARKRALAARRTAQIAAHADDDDDDDDGEGEGDEETKEEKKDRTYKTKMPVKKAKASTSRSPSRPVPPPEPDLDGDADADGQDEEETLANRPQRQRKAPARFLEEDHGPMVQPRKKKTKIDVPPAPSSSATARVQSQSTDAPVSPFRGSGGGGYYPVATVGAGLAGPMADFDLSPVQLRQPDYPGFSQAYPSMWQPQAAQSNRNPSGLTIAIPSLSHAPMVTPHFPSPSFPTSQQPPGSARHLSIQVTPAEQHGHGQYGWPPQPQPMQPQPSQGWAPPHSAHSTNGAWTNAHHQPTPHYGSAPNSAVPYHHQQQHLQNQVLHPMSPPPLTIATARPYGASNVGSTATTPVPTSHQAEEQVRVLERQRIMAAYHQQAHQHQQEHHGKGDLGGSDLAAIEASMFDPQHQVQSPLPQQHPHQEQLQVYGQPSVAQFGYSGQSAPQSFHHPQQPLPSPHPLHQPQPLPPLQQHPQWTQPSFGWQQPLPPATAHPTQPMYAHQAPVLHSQQPIGAGLGMSLSRHASLTPRHSAAPSPRERQTSFHQASLPPPPPLVDGQPMVGGPSPSPGYPNEAAMPVGARGPDELVDPATSM